MSMGDKHRQIAINSSSYISFSSPNMLLFPPPSFQCSGQSSSALHSEVSSKVKLLPCAPWAGNSPTSISSQCSSASKPKIQLISKSSKSREGIYVERTKRNDLILSLVPRSDAHCIDHDHSFIYFKPACFYREVVVRVAGDLEVAWIGGWMKSLLYQTSKGVGRALTLRNAVGCMIIGRLTLRSKTFPLN